MNISTALQQIRDHVRDSELPIGTWENIKEATDCLGEKLSLTPIQCCIMAQLMDYYSNKNSEEELCYYVDWETEDIICAKEELLRLVERGVVYPTVPFYHSGKKQQHYTASDAFENAYRKGGELIAPWNLGHKTYEFWAGVGMVFCTLKQRKVREDAIFYALRNLIADNRSLKCCKRLMEQNLDGMNLSLLLFVASEYLIKDQKQVENYTCMMYFKGDIIEKIAGQMEDKTSELHTKHLIQMTRDEGCFFSLTEHARQLLFDGDRIMGVLDTDCTFTEDNDDECLVCQTTQQDVDVVSFWWDISHILNKRSAYEIRYGEMERKLMKMVKSCQHLDCCKRLTEQNLNCFDFVFLIVLCSVYDCQWENHSLNVYKDLMPYQCINLIVSQFEDKTSDLLRKNLVRMSDDFTTVSLTDYAKNLFIDPKLMNCYG